MSTREEFLGRLRRGPEQEEPQLPPARLERGEELVDRFAAAAEAAGAVVHRRLSNSLLQSEVSRAAYGLADTGSVVVLSSDEARARSLLPESWTVVLAVERIVPGLRELFAELGPELPSGVAIVTGPSRTADIDQRLTIGVHGPGEVHIVLD